MVDLSNARVLDGDATDVRVIGAGGEVEYEQVIVVRIGVLHRRVENPPVFVQLSGLAVGKYTSRADRSSYVSARMTS